MGDIPDRDPLHQFVGRRAAELLAEYNEVRSKKGKHARQRELGLKFEALELLKSALDAPTSLMMLFDSMLGGVVHQVQATDSSPPWISKIVDYEARAHNEDRTVDNAELVRRVVMPSRPEVSDREGVMREVREVRNSKWYPGQVLSRRMYLMDNPETVSE